MGAPGRRRARALSTYCLLTSSSARKAEDLHRYRCLRGREPCHFLPALEALDHLCSLGWGGKEGASRSAGLGHGPRGGEAALGLPGGCNPRPAALPLTPGLRGILRAGVQIARLTGLHPREHLLLCGTVALELARDEHPRNILAALEPLAEGFLGGLLIPPAWSQNIQAMPLLIHRPPQLIPFTVEGEQDCLQVPLVPGLGSSMTELLGIGLAKLPAPLPAGFVGHRDPAGKQQLCDLALAKATPAIEPNRAAQDLDREAVVLRAVGGWCVQAPSMAPQASARQAAQQVDNAPSWPHVSASPLVSHATATPRLLSCHGMRAGRR